MKMMKTPQEHPSRENEPVIAAKYIVQLYVLPRFSKCSISMHHLIVMPLVFEGFSAYLLTQSILGNSIVILLAFYVQYFLIVGNQVSITGIVYH